MRNDESYIELMATTEDKETSNRMIKELEKWDVFRDAKFDEKLPDLVGELHDKGVEIEELLGFSRRIVFKGKYNNRNIVIKFSHALRTEAHDEKQQQKEEMIWETATKNGDQQYFAEILFGNMSSEFVVQEYCTDLLKVAELDDLNLDHQEIADKYDIRELLLGKNSKNNLVFVDYGN